LLKDYNFTSPVISDLIDGLEGPSGSSYLSKTHRITRDREKLIIQPLKDSSTRKFYIEDPYREINEPLQIEMDVLPKNKQFRISADPSIAFLDLDRLEFPLIIRKWEKGDYFRPLGMKGLKKLSDFFIDIKLPLPEKENTWLLTSGPEIIWVIGIRIDDRFKISPDTKRILRIRIRECG
jgi:tRNA(Ile)-lysidine synthase